jgi:hypothetical protein
MSGKQSSSVSVVTNYGLKYLKRWLISWQGHEIYLFLTNAETGSGAYKACYSTGTVSSFPECKVAGT